MTLPAKAIYDMYRGRADSENRIKEVKYDFSVDKYVSHDFWATEACNIMLCIRVCVLLYVCSAVYETRTYGAMRGSKNI